MEFFFRTSFSEQWSRGGLVVPYIVSSAPGQDEGTGIQGMGNVGSILFFLFTFSFPSFHVTDDNILIFGRNQGASDNVLGTEAQIGIQHVVQLLGKVDGYHDEAERDDILDGEEKATGKR